MSFRRLPKFLLPGLAAGALLLGLLAASPAADLQPPKTKADDTRDTYGSVQVADPYRWLEDQKSPETRAWIDEQKSVTPVPAFLRRARSTPVARLGDAEDRHDRRAARSTAAATLHSPVSVQDLPVVFVRRARPERTRSCSIRIPRPTTPRRSTFSTSSRTGRYALTASARGGEDGSPSVSWTWTRKELSDVLPRPLPGSACRNDRAGVFFSRQEKEGPRVYHAFGADSSKDEKIFGDGYGPEKAWA
jgi:prolyl oligopeptidase